MVPPARPPVRPPACRPPRPSSRLPRRRLRRRRGNLLQWIAALGLNLGLNLGLSLVLALGLPPAAALAAAAPPEAGSTVLGPPLARPAWWSAGPSLVVDAGAHASAVRRVGVHRPSDTLITVSDDKSVRIWDLASGDLKRVFRASIGPSRRGALHGVAPHPTEDLVALGGNTGDLSGPNRILLIRPSDATLVAEFDARGAFIRDLGWSGDASLLLAVYQGNDGVRAFNRRGEMVFEARLRSAATALSIVGDRAVAASADGEILVLGARDGRVTELARHQRPDRSLASIALSPDGQRMAVGYRREQAAVEILNVADGRIDRLLPSPRLAAGSIQNVAWSADGRSIHAAGRGYESSRDQVAVFRYDANSGALLGRVTAARDSILELRALADGRLAYGAFDGSWGLISQDSVTLESTGALPDFRGPENLRISPSGRQVTWSDDGGNRQARFDFDSRLFTREPASDALLAPVTRRGLFDGNRWLNERSPMINGLSLPMAQDELSLSLAYLRQAGDEALVGTQRRLIRISASGATRWQVVTSSEVRAVNVSADDRLVVTAMADGTLRWWRASDGQALLTLLVARDGRWVAWTPDGHFDASPGADRIVGWAVNRLETSGADFVSLNRFGAERNRPEAIDQAIGVPQSRRVASKASPTASAPASAPAPSPTSPSTSALPSPPAPPPAQLTQVTDPAPKAPAAFPPVARWLGSPRADDGRGRLQIPIAYRSTSGAAATIQARFNGRPAPDIMISALAGRVDAGERGVTVEVPLPRAETVIQVLLSDRNGTSESLTLTYRPPPPLLAQASQAGPAPQRIDVGLMVPAVARPPSSAPSSVITPALPPDTPAAVAGEKPSRLFLLSIGISHYQRTDYNLGLAAKDANDFAQAMKEQAGRLYPVVQTRVLDDQRASRAAVEAGLDWIAQTTGPDDVAMVFMAGHGLNGDDGRYYFLPHDADHQRLAETAIDEDRLRVALSRIRGKVVMFVDTCFGGAVISSAGSTELRRMANSLASPENGVIVFASSSGRQESLENDAWGNGAFTKALVAGIRGQADLYRNGRITYKSLDFYVSDAVTRLTEGKQTPVTITPIGIPDFLLAVN